MKMDRKNDLARRAFLQALSLGIAAPLALQASRLARLEAR